MSTSKSLILKQLRLSLSRESRPRRLWFIPSDRAISALECTASARQTIWAAHDCREIWALLHGLGDVQEDEDGAPRVPFGDVSQALRHERSSVTSLRIFMSFLRLGTTLIASRLWDMQGRRRIRLAWALQVQKR